ncbi:DegT/DnrJ/EryC1/StrS family aminotransferase [Spirochaetota bacterium]
MQIPFHKSYITEDEITAVTDTLRSGWITMGKKTREFENSFSEYLGVKNSVSFNSGTAALHLALKVLNIKEGDEVMLPAMTFAATSEVITYFNAKPVFIDVDKNTHLMDVNKIEEKITNKTRAIIPVHYAGQPCDMEEVLDIAKRKDLFIVDDAAHSLPSWYKKKIIGSISHITCFSFYATKTITAGEGGMAVTQNDDWAERMRLLRLHGLSKDAWKRYSDRGNWEYDVVEPGYKYNTTDMNSALGIEQLKKVEDMWKKREKIAAKYNDAFKINDIIIPYSVKNDRVSSWHLYPIKLMLEALSIDRNHFIDELQQRGISTSVHFIPLYRFSCYRNVDNSIDKFPGCEWVFDRIISLPIFPAMTDDEINYVIENVIDIAGKNKR